jgi:AraC-like DNA-binding protein
MKSSYTKTAINPFPSKGELTVLFTGDSQTVPNHKYVQIMLEFVLVHFIISGRGEFISKNQTYTLGPGDSFFIFPNDIATYIADTNEPWRYRWIALKGDFALPFFNEIGISSKEPIARCLNIEGMNGLFDNIFNSLESAQDSCDMEAEGYTRVLLSKYMNHQNKVIQQLKISTVKIPPEIDQALRWMKLQYMEAISIQTLSSNLGYHRTHFSKLFKQIVGLSPMQYLINLRLERAASMLRGKEPYTIEEIAFSVGLRDPLYFSKLFKKKFGFNPSSYRKTHSSH